MSTVKILYIPSEVFGGRSSNPSSMNLSLLFRLQYYKAAHLFLEKSLKAGYKFLLGIVASLLNGWGLFIERMSSGFKIIKLFIVESIAPMATS